MPSGAGWLMPSREAQLSALFDALEQEFDVVIAPVDRGGLATPGALVPYVITRLPPPGESMEPDEVRDYVMAVLGEVLAREVGASQYDLDAPWPISG